MPFAFGSLIILGNEDKMKTLVTGGAGFIGSNVVKLLLEREHDVTVLDNLSTGYEKNILPFKDKIKFIKADITQYDDIDSYFSGIDSVIHLAASVGNKKSIDEPIFDATANVLGTINILQAMKKYNVKTIVYSSSAGIFGEPQYQPVDEKHPCEPDSPYGATKLCAEKLILSYAKLYNFKSVCLRYFNVYGENQRFDAYGNVIPIFASRALESSSITIFGDGEQTRDFIHVEDIAKANVFAAELEGAFGTINLGTGKKITINKLATMINEISKKDVEIIHKEKRPGDVLHCTADNSKMKEMLNIEAQVISLETLSKYYEWLKGDS